MSNLEGARPRPVNRVRKRRKLPSRECKTKVRKSLSGAFEPLTPRSKIRIAGSPSRGATGNIATPPSVP